MKLIFIPIFLQIILINFTLFANDKKLGIKTGINYFIKTQQIGYTPVDKTNKAIGGKLLYDDNGFSFQAGLIYNLTKLFTITGEYRLPRKCSYSYPSVWTPWVWGPNTYWVKTETSSWDLSIRYNVTALSFLKPYVGIGYEQVRLKAWYRSGHIRGDTGELLYIDPEYYYQGHKRFNGFLISAGARKQIIKNLLFEFGIRYTFVRLKEWTSYVDANQNLGGLYIHSDIIFMVF